MTLIQPHGGSLCDLLVNKDERIKIQNETLNNPSNGLMNSIRNDAVRNNLKKVDREKIEKKKAMKLSGNENTLGRRQSSVVDELKSKINSYTCIIQYIARLLFSQILPLLFILL